MDLRSQSDHPHSDSERTFFQYALKSTKFWNVCISWIQGWEHWTINGGTKLLLLIGTHIEEHGHRNIKIEIQWSVCRLLISESLEVLPFLSSHLANEKPLLRAMPFQLKVRKKSTVKSCTWNVSISIYYALFLFLSFFFVSLYCFYFLFPSRLQRWGLRPTGTADRLGWTAADLRLTAVRPPFDRCWTSVGPLLGRRWPVALGPVGTAAALAQIVSPRPGTTRYNAVRHGPTWCDGVSYGSRRYRGSYGSHLSVTLPGERIKRR